MTYGNDTCEMIELCNKRTFFDLPRKPCNSAIFPSFSKKKKFQFLLNWKNKKYLHHLQTVKK